MRRCVRFGQVSYAKCSYAAPSCREGSRRRDAFPFVIFGRELDPDKIRLRYVRRLDEFSRSIN
jgi:hypothetical protein